MGSAWSTVPGQPVFTLQYEQARVQVSPRIMKVAVPRSQHSPMFGHAASSQTVFRLAPLILLRISRKFSLPGALTLNQSGRRRSTDGDPTFSDFETNDLFSITLIRIDHLVTVISAELGTSSPELVQNNRQGIFLIDYILFFCESCDSRLRHEFRNGKA